jgi:hypothetical protein
VTEQVLQSVHDIALGKKMRYHKVLLPDGGVKAIM